MIPKIIHYCWFGPKPYSRTVRRCMETWHKVMPDYEFMLWNESNSPMEHPYVASAYAAGKYAFVADYVRFWALHQYGGIYLDTDMYVIRRFDDLLENDFFTAYETADSGSTDDSTSNNDGRAVSCGALGACALGAVTKRILERYDELVYSDDTIETLIVPRLITPIIRSCDEVTIYPYDYFYPFPYENRLEHSFLRYATCNTYAIHLWNLSWTPLWKQYVGYWIHKIKVWKTNILK